MCKRRLWKWVSLHRCPIGEPVGGLIYQGLCETDGGLWKQSLSLCGKCVRGTWREDSLTGDPWKGSSFPRDLERRVRFFCQENFYWGIQETHKRRLWKQANFSKGAPLGNLEGVSFTGDCCETDDRRLWKWSIPLWEVCEGNMQGGSSTGEPKVYVKEGTGNRHLSP